MKRFSGKKGFVILIFLACLIVGYYAYLSNHNSAKQEEDEAAILSNVEKALSRDLETNYPPTPREVIKYFSEISECFYNEEYSEEKLVKLADKIRLLYDDELVANQTEDEYIKQLKEDIEEFNENKRTIYSYAPSSSIDVETFTEDGYEWARLYCLYSIKEGAMVKKSNTQFLLRKDSDGHYKIYGWKLVETE